MHPKGPRGSECHIAGNIALREINHGFWLVTGLVFTLGGLIGAFLPILPAVPFLLVAAYAFSKSSKRFHDWLINHRIFGPQILDWQKNGSISRRVKWITSLSMLFGVLLSAALGLGMKIVLIQCVTISIAYIFIWTRPDAKRALAGQ